MDEVKKHHGHIRDCINEIHMTCKEHCHTTDTYVRIFYYVAHLVIQS